MRQATEIRAEMVRLQEQLAKLEEELHQSKRQKRVNAVREIECILERYDSTDYAALFDLKTHYEQDISDEKLDSIMIAEDRVVISLALPLDA